MMIRYFLLLIPMFQENTLQINKDQRSVSFDAIFQTSLYNGAESDLHNHHFLVWREGRAVENALLAAQVSDMKILKALEQLGAQAGNNLSAKAWTKRFDKNHPDPDEHVSGTPVVIEVSWDNGTPVTAEALFEDHGGKGFTFAWAAMQFWPGFGARGVWPAWRAALGRG